MDFLIELDKVVTIYLNSLHTSFLDPIMFFISGKKEWIPLYAVLLFSIFYKRNWKEALMIIVSIGIVIALCDRVSSGFFKPFFERFRPSRDPEISNLVHIINDYRGGKYGFLSSHAANSFGLAVFISYIFQKKWISISLISWAVIVSYSRIYLGVHYLGDVICGAILGTLLAFLVYKLYIYFRKKYILNIE